MDWTGNKHSIFTTLGASNHTDKERQAEDYYATDPVAIDKLAKVFDIPEKVWECACGGGILQNGWRNWGTQWLQPTWCTEDMALVALTS